MIFREIGQEEKSRWNEFISSQATGHIFQSYEWGSLKAKYGWFPHRLVVEENGRIKAAALVLEKKIPLLGETIFYSPRGPVIDFEDTATFDFLLKEINKLALRQRAIFWQVDPDLSVQSIQTCATLEKRGFLRGLTKYVIVGLALPKRVFRLTLMNRSEEELFSRLSQKHRYYVRRAAKKGVNIVQENTLDGLRQAYDVLKETGSRKKFVIHSLEYLRSLYEEFSSVDGIKIFLAEHENKVIACRILLRFGRKCWDMYAGSAAEGSGLRASYLLVWEIIRWAKKEDCLWFDFRGADSPDPHHPLHGIYKFKKGFNPELVEFVGENYLVYSKFYFNLLNAGKGLFNFMTRKNRRFLSKLYPHIVNIRKFFR
jgi:peptidoglycan pentaglycine glycine transferase (the first glycine)